MAALFPFLRFKRRRRRRRAVSKTERGLSLGALCLLPLIAAAVAIKGEIYDPDRYVLDDALLAGTAAPIAEPAHAPPLEASAFDDYGDGYGDIPPARSDAPPVSAADSFAAIAGLEALGPPEEYDADNLYEKINGQAEAYLAQGFETLRFQSFVLEDDPGQFLDLYEYEMGQPIGAYGIWSLERDPDAEPVDFAPHGYQDPLGIYFRQGRHYVQVIASEVAPRAQALALALARARAKALPDDDAGLEGIGALPAVGLDPASVRYTERDAYGVAGLSEVFEGAYASGAGPLRFFIARPGDPQAAEAAFLGFADLQRRLGALRAEEEIESDAGRARLFVAESYGEWTVAAWRGAEVCAVVGAPDEAVAREFIGRHLARERRP